jgi:hypothetical protein
VNYSSLTQGITTNAYRQQKEEDLEAERIRAKKISDDDRAELKIQIELSNIEKVKEAKVAEEKKLEEQKAMETEQKAMESEQKSIAKVVPDEEFSASENECPASPASPEYEVIQPKVTGSEEKASVESGNSMPELVVLTQRDTQPEANLDLDSSFAEIREKIRSWKKEREPEEIKEESFVGEDVLTIDTDDALGKVIKQKDSER